MNLEFYYWYFQSALKPEICEKIIEYGNSKREETALTGKQSEKALKGEKLSEEDLKDLKKKRDSNIAWISEKWLYDIIHPYVYGANKSAGWNFQWDWSEAVQFTKYKLNQYYDWHQDAWPKPYDENANENVRGKIRKLSAVIQLSKPEDYKGGDFEIDFKDNVENNIRKIDEFKPQGSIIIFPSFVWHRVAPVTEGTRYSLVCWNCGEPWK